jgi:hypothetical protein
MILKKTKITNWSPIIDAIVTNLHNGQETLTTERFLVDSGASLSILGPSLGNLFSDTVPFDSFYVAYGSGTKQLDVFKVKLTMQGGYQIEILAALDTTLRFKNHLLGVTKGFEHFDHLVLNNKSKLTKLVKKY